VGYDKDGNAINARWVDLDDYSNIIESTGSYVDLVAPCGHGTYPNGALNATIRKHLKPGGLITWTNNQNQDYKTTKDLKTAPFSLIVNPDNQGHAQGKVYLDREDSTKRQSIEFKIINRTDNIPTGYEFVDVDLATQYKATITAMLSAYSIVALSDGNINGFGYGNTITRDPNGCDAACAEKLIVNQQHPYEWYEFYYSGHSIKKWVLNENNTES
jgi:hypothetical protein